MTTVKLLGTDGTGDADSGANYIVFNKFTCSASGRVIELRVYSHVGGNCKIALYSDNAGEPNALLADGGAIACAANTWNAATISYAVTNGTVYWIAFILDTLGTGRYHDAAGSGVRRFKIATYATYTFPATYNGSGFTSDTVCDSLAGWGTEAGGGGITTKFNRGLN